MRVGLVLSFFLFSCVATEKMSFSYDYEKIIFTQTYFPSRLTTAQRLTLYVQAIALKNQEIFFSLSPEDPLWDIEPLMDEVFVENGHVVVAKSWSIEYPLPATIRLPEIHIKATSPQGEENYLLPQKEITISSILKNKNDRTPSNFLGPLPSRLQTLSFFVYVLGLFLALAATYFVLLFLKTRQERALLSLISQMSCRLAEIKSLSSDQFYTQLEQILKAFFAIENGGCKTHGKSLTREYAILLEKSDFPTRSEQARFAGKQWSARQREQDFVLVESLLQKALDKERDAQKRRKNP